MELVRACTGIRFPSLAHTIGAEVVVHVDQLKAGNSVALNGTEVRLPRDQSSWVAGATLSTIQYSRTRQTD